MSGSTLTRTAADYAAAALPPLRDLADGQRDFADQVTHWAELQRDLVDNMCSWAARVRRQPRTAGSPLPARPVAVHDV